MTWYCLQYVLMGEQVGYMTPVREIYFQAPDIDTAQAIADCFDVKILMLSESKPKTGA